VILATNHLVIVGEIVKKKTKIEPKKRRLSLCAILTTINKVKKKLRIGTTNIPGMPNR